MTDSIKRLQGHLFPWIASGLGLTLALVLWSATGEEGGEPLLPGLTLLFMSEFGFLVTLAGAWVAGRTWYGGRQGSMLLLGATCGIMALAFLYLGIALWSGLAPVE